MFILPWHWCYRWTLQYWIRYWASVLWSIQFWQLEPLRLRCRFQPFPLIWPTVPPPAFCYHDWKNQILIYIIMGWTFFLNINPIIYNIIKLIINLFWTKSKRDLANHHFQLYCRRQCCITKKKPTCKYIIHILRDGLKHTLNNN